MSRKSNRRQLLRNAVVGGVGFWVAGRPARVAAKSPNEKLDLACIGVGGRGSNNLEGMRKENVVAICDVDEYHARGAFKIFEKAEKFNDYRKLLDKLHGKIDAVVVSTPDHMHAPITLAALELGKHVYCEKPLTRTIAEARRVAEATRKYKRVTQMGNGGNARSASRRTVEMLQAQSFGPVREVHIWTDRPIKWWPQGVERPTSAVDVPKTLEWDLWLGGAPKRPYHPAYLPFKWRGWWDFGTGALGDIACHACNVAFWGLGLTSPTVVEAETSERFKETAPVWSIISYQFPAVGKRPPVMLRWYDGGKKPPRELGDGSDLPGNGQIYIGDKGRSYMGSSALLPKEDFADFKPPPQTIPDAPKGNTEDPHHAEWIAACKAGKLLPGMSEFGHRAGPMTEALLVGNLAVRTGKRIEWDAKKLKCTNVPEANAYVDEPYRTGW